MFEGTGWPDYANHLIFELYTADSGLKISESFLSIDYYVQLVYEGVPLLVPGCPATMCPFSTFEELAKALIPTVSGKE